MQIRQRDNLQRTSWKLLTDRLASTKGVLLVLGLLFFLFFFTVRSSGSRSNTQLFTTQRNAHVTPAHSITRRICTPCQGYPYTLKHQLVTHKPAPTTKHRRKRWQSAATASVISNVRSSVKTCPAEHTSPRLSMTAVCRKSYSRLSPTNVKNSSAHRRLSIWSQRCRRRVSEFQPKRGRRRNANDQGKQEPSNMKKEN